VADSRKRQRFRIDHEFYRFAPSHRLNLHSNRRLLLHRAYCINSVLYIFSFVTATRVGDAGRLACGLSRRCATRQTCLSMELRGGFQATQRQKAIHRIINAR